MMNAAKPFRLMMGRAAPGPKRAIIQPVADSYTPQNHFRRLFIMAKFDFTANTITCAGRTFPVKFSVTPSGTVFVFVTMPDRHEPARVKFTPKDEAYTAALAAARGELSGEYSQPEEAAPVEGEQPAAEPAPVEIEQPAPVEAAPAEIEQPAAEAAPADDRPEIISSPAEAAPAEIEQPAAGPAPAEIEQPAPRPVPEKTFIGETITGKGWRILFDGETQRTRVLFDAAPTDAARAAVEKAGFYFSAGMNSFNKKLTFKAHRAAVALSGELAALYA